MNFDLEKFEQALEKVKEYIQDKDEFNINDYLEWASERDIDRYIAEDVIIDLVNDGLIKEREDHITFMVVR